MADDGAGSCISDQNYLKAESKIAEANVYAANWRIGTATTIAVLNAAQLLENYRKQKELSDRANAIARAIHDNTKTVYWDNEVKHLAKWGNGNTTGIEPVADLSRRYGGRMVATVANALAKKRKEVMCNATRYCTSALSKQLQDLMIAEASAVANARMLADNIAFTENQSREDVSVDRRLQAIGFGKGLSGQAAAYMAKAGEGLLNAGSTLQQRTGSALGRFEQALGQRAYASAQQRYYDNVTSTTPEGTFNSTLFQSQQVFTETRFGQSSGGEVNLNTPSYMGDNNPYPQYQTQRMNNGIAGDESLARFGNKTYVINGTDSGGDTFNTNVTVKMSDFELKYTQDKKEGDK